MPYTLNIEPVLFHIGPLEIRYYGLVYVLGFLLVYLFLRHYKDKLNLSLDEIDELIIYLFVGVILGSRLFEVIFWEPSYYLAHPLKIFAFWEGGMAFHGGLIGAAIASYIFYRKHSQLNIAKLADVLVFPAVIALALGRIANFINAELVGTVANVPWCVNFEGYEGCRHPSQLYGAIKRFFVLIILVILNFKEHKDGFLFWMFVALMGIGRFFIDFYREDTRAFGLSMGQYLGLIMFIIGSYVLIRFYWLQRVERVKE